MYWSKTTTPPQIDDLKKVSRFQEPPKEGAFCDILWSDPVDNEVGVCEPPFAYNSVRGCSYYYGKEAVNRFLDDNQLLSVIRGHEAQLDGYKMSRWNGDKEFPPVITIFSAPNYCDAYKNKGAVIKFAVFLLVYGTKTMQIGQSAKYTAICVYATSVPLAQFYEPFRMVNTVLV